jgi:hypothetical protein
MSIIFERINQPESVQESVSKNEKFRLDIRRKHKEKIFKSMREQFA